MAVVKVVDFPVVQDVQISLSWCMMPDIMADIEQLDSYALHLQWHVQGWYCW